MITLDDLFDIATLPLVDAETGKKIDTETLIKDAKCQVYELSCGLNFDFLVKYYKEPEDE